MSTSANEPKQQHADVIDYVETLYNIQTGRETQRNFLYHTYIPKGYYLVH